MAGLDLFSIPISHSIQIVSNGLIDIVTSDQSIQLGFQARRVLVLVAFVRRNNTGDAIFHK